MRRLKTTEVAAWRQKLAAAQGGTCAICRQPLGTKAPLDPVLDHCHTTGIVRGVLHRGCNALLGKLENNVKRYGVRDPARFLSGAWPYLAKHANVIGGGDVVLHPTHKTEDEKRELRNKRARAARAKKKEQA